MVFIILLKSVILIALIYMCIEWKWKHNFQDFFKHFYDNKITIDKLSYDYLENAKLIAKHWSY